ncbi:unnamed protein product [Eruca vesicaria subsp. sativa]|uniref:Reverse transcriptase zinc-binding domain-containing protein n=1 Tax=Eruca vesicaria subsp. sativa TaxID=29727 RepID=A0ABC8JPA6_ERUVS|nr:unnamed protein product [Eruca vesicaria subsp. sativa]
MSLNRCLTRYRLRQWGLQSDASCLLCGDNDESRNHLYFNCNCSSEICSSIASRFEFLPQGSWHESINQMQAITRNSFRRKLLR